VQKSAVFGVSMARSDRKVGVQPMDKLEKQATFRFW